MTFVPNVKLLICEMNWHCHIISAVTVDSELHALRYSETVPNISQCLAQLEEFQAALVFAVCYTANHKINRKI